MTSSLVERKSKYNPKKYNKSGRTIHTSFDISALDLLCSFVTSDNRNIRRSQIISLRNMIALLDMSLYESDQAKMERIHWINAGLDARLNYNLNNRELIIKHIEGGLMEPNHTSNVKLIELSNEEVDWVCGTIAGALDFSATDNLVDNIMDVCTRFKEADYTNKRDIIDELKDSIKLLQTEFRRHASMAGNAEYITTEEASFQPPLADTYNRLKNPANILRSGMQGMNAILQGGFESTRLYVFMGLPGEGKSVTLLNLAYQIQQCNPDYRPKDPTKKPCVVYLTMENMLRETISRFYSIATGHENMTDRTLEEVVREFKEIGNIMVESNNIQLILKYVPDGSVDTSYLYDFTEQLSDDGYEVCCFVQDYIKKIRPVAYTGDYYQDLGSVVSEMKTFAILNDAVVITAAQCNREAAQIVDNARRNNNTDIVKQLSRANTGESMQIVHNADAIMMITPEVDRITGDRYLGVNQVKIRYNNSQALNLMYAFLPFAPNSSIKLLMDVGLSQPLYKETMNANDGPEMNKGSSNSIRMSTSTSSFIKSGCIVDMNAPTDNRTPNLFDSGYGSEYFKTEDTLIDPFIVYQ